MSWYETNLNITGFGLCYVFVFEDRQDNGVKLGFTLTWSVLHTHTRPPGFSWISWQTLGMGFLLVDCEDLTISELAAEAFLAADEDTVNGN